MRIALGIEYEGGAFCGWQTQPSGCGVQDRLQLALAEIAHQTIEITCAGRTDAGVHAHWQVVHFDTDADRPQTAWVRGVNAMLPPAVSVLWARPVASIFHARFDALSRSYRYVLVARSVRAGLLHRRVGWWHAPLDVDAMRKASDALIGQHDFSAFRAAECQAKSPVRVLTRLDIRAEGAFVIFELRANAFLQHMVRNIIGSLVYVGAGRQPARWMAALLEGRDRRLAAPTFAADGLYLTAVEYSPAAGLPVAPDALLPF